MERTLLFSRSDWNKTAFSHLKKTKIFVEILDLSASIFYNILRCWPSAPHADAFSFSICLLWLQINSVGSQQTPVHLPSVSLHFFFFSPIVFCIFPIYEISDDTQAGTSHRATCTPFPWWPIAVVLETHFWFISLFQYNSLPWKLCFNFAVSN